MAIHSFNNHMIVVPITLSTYAAEFFWLITMKINVVCSVEPLLLRTAKKGTGNSHPLSLSLQRLSWLPYPLARRIHSHLVKIHCYVLANQDASRGIRSCVNFRGSPI